MDLGFTVRLEATPKVDGSRNKIAALNTWSQLAGERLSCLLEYGALLPPSLLTYSHLETTNMPRWRATNSSPDSVLTIPEDVSRSTKGVSPSPVGDML